MPHRLSPSFPCLPYPTTYRGRASLSFPTGEIVLCCCARCTSTTTFSRRGRRTTTIACTTASCALLSPLQATCHSNRIIYVRTTAFRRAFSESSRLVINSAALALLAAKMLVVDSSLRPPHSVPSAWTQDKDDRLRRRRHNF